MALSILIRINHSMCKSLNKLCHSITITIRPCATTVNCLCITLLQHKTSTINSSYIETDKPVRISPC